MKMKMKYSPADLCTYQGNFFVDILEYAYSMKIDEEPNYSKLDFMLKKIMLDMNIRPVVKFQWWF